MTLQSPARRELVQQDVIKRNMVKRQACTSRNLGLVVCSAPPAVPRVKKHSDNKEPPDRSGRWTIIARRRQVAEAPTKPISGAVSHCATQYVVKRAEHVSAVVEGGGLLVSTRLKAVVGRQPKSAASAVGETLTSFCLRACGAFGLDRATGLVHRPGDWERCSATVQACDIYKYTCGSSPCGQDWQE